MMTYPHQHAFEAALLRDALAKTSIDDYSHLINRLFNYLLVNNEAFANHPVPDNIFDRDLEDFLSAIGGQHPLSLSSYNKTLSQLNRYFVFLYSHQLSQRLPTISMHGKPLTQAQNQAPSKWLILLPTILKTDSLTWYTRLVLLLTSKGYQTKEMLKPGFNQQLSTSTWTDVEQTFFQHFLTYLAPIQQRQHCDDLFLKQRFNQAEPHLTLPALHKYLKQDETTLGFSLAPRYLYQTFVLNQIDQHPTLTNQQLSQRLNIDPQSLSYYLTLATNRANQ